jgi:hypothetical protein
MHRLSDFMNTFAGYSTVTGHCFSSFQLAAVAALCVQYESDFRPNMTIVVKAIQPLLNAKPAGPPAAAQPQS